MKFIHTADIHLDAKQNSSLSGDLRATRKNELLMAFKNLINYAKQNQVTAIIIAGDFFDVKNVSNKTRSYVFDLIKKHEDIDFLYLCGNHDENLSVLGENEYPQNLKVFSNSVQTFSYENVTISGIELSNSNYNTFYDTINLPQDKVNIFVLHGQIDGKAQENYEKISLKQLKQKNIDYLALGHYHTYDTGAIDKRGIYAYSGCLEGRGFDELGPKGFVLLEIENGVLTHKFVQTSIRQIVQVSVDVTNMFTYSQQEEQINLALKNIDKQSLVKLVFTGNVTINQKIDFNHWQTVFGKQFFFVKIENQTKLIINPEDYKNDISLKGQFINEVLNSNLPQSTKDQIITLGISVLLGEEVEL